MNMPTVDQLKKFLEVIPSTWEINLNSDDDIVAYDPKNDEVVLIFPMRLN